MGRTPRPSSCSSHAASQIVDSFEIDETNVHDVIAICHELDGLPLAIELAATRVRTLAPQEIRERLSDRLRLLRGGRGRAERHQTMRRTVEWSYQLLTPAESVLLNRLSVFAGGFTLAAAEDVCDGPPLERDAVLDALDSLVAKSLVVAEVRRGTTRYRLLETIRQFAGARAPHNGRNRDPATALRHAFPRNPDGARRRTR